ncbi:MAG: hypothetical protein LLG42_16455, partial [Chloroflexi bacterium]|nr:hypothetical protein [Chloroflexota bacterium]
IIGKRDEPEASKPPVRVEGLEGYFVEKYIREARIGNRNESAFNLALQLRDCGLTIYQAASHMVKFAGRVPQAQNARYTEREALLTLKSAYSRPKREPAEVQNGQS